MSETYSGLGNFRELSDHKHSRSLSCNSSLGSESYLLPFGYEQVYARATEPLETVNIISLIEA